MILDAQNFSEHVNLDALIMLFGYTKSKHWHPIRFRKLISNLVNEIQVSASKYLIDFENVFKCKSDGQTAEGRHVFDITDSVVVYNSPKNKLILFPLTIKMKQATLFKTHVNPAKHKATVSEAPSKVKPAKSFCH